MLNHVASLISPVLAIAKEAGVAILSIYNQSDEFAVTKKADHTPVTAADLLANQLIIEKLQALTPHVPILTEESADIPYQIRRTWPQYWLVDPLDGTKEFIKKNGEFTVNIALISHHRAILGVIHAPVLNVYYYAAENFGAYKQEGEKNPLSINTHKGQDKSVRVAGSRSHAQNKLQLILEKLEAYELISMGSSLKSCLVAEGAADIYPRLGPTSEWDTAAAQCIVEESGGAMTDLAGQRLSYNTKDSLINASFLVVGDKTLDWLRLFSGVD